MIVKQDILKQTNDDLKRQIELFGWGLGKYDLQVSNADKSSIEFVIQKFSYRYKLNKQIQGVIDWMKQLNSNVKIEIIPGTSHDVFVMTMKTTSEKKEKQKPTIDEPAMISSDEKTT